MTILLLTVLLLLSSRGKQRRVIDNNTWFLIRDVIDNNTFFFQHMFEHNDPVMFYFQTLVSSMIYIIRDPLRVIIDIASSQFTKCERPVWQLN